jgi:hypothetical protein
MAANTSSERAATGISYVKRRLVVEPALPVRVAMSWFVFCQRANLRTLKVGGYDHHFDRLARWLVAAGR